jgi:hypothetical protein
MGRNRSGQRWIESQAAGAGVEGGDPCHLLPVASGGQQSQLKVDPEIGRIVAPLGIENLLGGRTGPHASFRGACTEQLVSTQSTFWSYDQAISKGAADVNPKLPGGIKGWLNNNFPFS